MLAANCVRPSAAARFRRLARILNSFVFLAGPDIGGNVQPPHPNETNKKREASERKSPFDLFRRFRLFRFLSVHQSKSSRAKSVPLPRA